MSLVRHEFGGAGVAYLRDYLDANDGFGKRLGRLVRTRDLEAGTTSAYVPSDSTPDQRGDFEHGGLFSRADPGASSGCPALERWLPDLMAGPGSAARLLCVEDALRRRSDPMPEAWSERPSFSCGDDVYWYATTPKDATNIMRPSATWTPNVAIVTTLPDGLSDIHDRQSLSPDALREMAGGAVAVLVGAWDAEGWLLWEPDQAPPTTTRSR